MNAYLDAMRNYANFEGRATRSEFWLFTLFVTLVVVCGLTLDIALGSEEEPIIATLAMLAHILPSVAIQSRRLHDTNKSGWLQLLALVPLGVLVLLFFYVSPSTPGPNQYDATNGGNRVLTPQASASPGYSASAVERLEKLASLKASGALDETEFQKMKSDIMNRAG
ncbi:MAG TPA: DUF805 domain-containing protein [Aestuariivirga sp.]|nr:DUF805 domain-containing protein [Aestuariivirga sp.]